MNRLRDMDYFFHVFYPTRVYHNIIWILPVSRHATSTSYVRGYVGDRGRTSLPFVYTNGSTLRPSETFCLASRKTHSPWQWRGRSWLLIPSRQNVSLCPAVVITGARVFRSLYAFRVQKDHSNDCTKYHVCWWSISNRGFRWSRPSPWESSKCKLVSSCGDYWGASFQEFVCV